LSRFQEVLQAHEVATTQESYKLDWLGKSYARLLANEPIRTLLSADVAHNSQAANLNSQNLLIQGDNLEVLKHLKGAYREAVKMIYIDPPYNTGSDGFVYQDDRKFTPEQLADLANVSLEEAKRILEFTQRGANSHSAWLTFMYPRLYVAKQLLRDDGVIFISIDDNEQAQLKLLCDEVFGEGNFVGELTWEKKKKGTFLSNHLTNVKESIFVFAKNLSSFNGLIGEINSEETTYPCINASNNRSTRVFPRGIFSKYKERNYQLTKGNTISVTTMELKLLSDLVIKDGILAEDLIIEGNWRYNQDAINEYAKKDEIYLTQDLYMRRIVKEDRLKMIKDLLTRVGTNPDLKYQHINTKNLFEDGWGSNEDAEEEVRILFEQKEIFSNPKPLKLIMKLIASTRFQEAIILDFFAGSGTTAHAVMQLNAEDGGNRQFICVQLDEKTDPKKEAYKAGYKSIFDITQARIQKAAQKIQSEHPNYTGNLGFKQFKTVPIFDNYQQPIAQFTPNIDLFDGTQLSPQDLANLLTTWQLQHNIPLSQTLNSIDLDGYIAHWFNDTLYLMAQGFDSPHLKAFIQKLDTDNSFTITKLIMFGYNINSKMQREIDEGLKNYRNKKSITLDVVVKY
jgi:adenine-specific DNA-methyltransferase